MKTRNFLQGLTVLSLAGLMVFPPAQALDEVTTPDTVVTQTVDTESEIATAQATSSLSLNVALGAGLVVDVPLTLNTSAYRDSVLQKIKEIRGKAWDDTSLPFQPYYNSKGAMSLQNYLKSRGITSKSQYQNMVKWDSNLERTALQRLYETNVMWGPVRPNGTQNYTASNGAISIEQAENLYGSADPSVALEAWSTAPVLTAYNQSDWYWLKREKGKFGPNQGELWNILNPDSKSFALASSGRTTVLSMSPEEPKNQSGLNYRGVYTVPVTINSRYLSTYTLSVPQRLAPWQTEQAKATATQHLTPSWTDIYLKGSTLRGTWTSSNTAVATVDSNGMVTGVGAGTATIKFVPSILDNSGRQTAATTSMSRQVTVSKQTFIDVPASAAFFNEIEWFAAQKITTGYPDKTYRPLDSVERGAIAAFFYRLAGSPSFTPPKESPFKDVSTSFPFYKEITWLAAQGITIGYEDGTFRPNAPINRDAIAAFFYRYAGKPSYTAPSRSPFNDLRPQDQFYKEISWFSDQKITTGWPDGGFHPIESVHRDAMAAFFYRYNQKYPR